LELINNRDRINISVATYRKIRELIDVMGKMRVKELKNFFALIKRDKKI